MNVWDNSAVAEGLRVQNELLARTLSQGERLIGWKIGLGSPAAQQKLGINAPLVGFLTSGAVLDPGATVPLEGWTKPACEPEIAVHLRHGLGPSATLTEVQDAIGALGPAIELADLAVPLDDLSGIVATNVFQRRVILGEPIVERAGGDLSGIAVRVTKSGVEVGSTADPEAIPGKLLDLVAHVAAWVAHAGHPLEAGQVIITGSVIPIIDVRPGDQIEYECKPMGRLAVTFS